MGTCNKALLSYGIIIPISQAVALLNALRKTPPAPEDSASWDTDEIDDTESWGYEYGEELGERIGSQLVAAGFDGQEFELRTLGNDREWEGLAVFFNGIYDEDEDDYAQGLEVEFWGTEGMTRAKRLVYKPWEDEEFMGPAKKAFNHLAKLPSFKEAGIEVDPDWLHAVSVS